jgi:hypothetical protein
VLQGGNELCRIQGFDRGKAISELKVSIEAEAGLVPALTRLINPESLVELQDYLMLEDAGMPSEQALAEGVIQLYAQTLQKVVVADELQIAPGEVTDTKLAVLCDSIRDDPPDVLVLCGCHRVTNISCLVHLSTISLLDISTCNLGAEGGLHLAGVIKDMGALSVLNLASNNLGELVLPEGWTRTGYDYNNTQLFRHTDGREQKGNPSKPEGVIAIANVIPDMGALATVIMHKYRLPIEDIKTKAELDLSGKGLADLDAIVLAALLPLNVSR